MVIPLSDLESAARDIVRRQLLDGELESLTKGNVRKKVEQRFNLDPGALSVKEYKHPLNSAIQTAVDKFDQDTTGKEEGVLMKQTEGRVKNQKEVKAPRKSKTMADPNPQPAKKKRGESSREYKSAAFIATSDMEEETEPGISSSGSKRALAHIISDDTVVEEDTKSNLPPLKRRKVDNINDESPKAKVPDSKVVAQDDTEKSESEMSVLIDETPKKKKTKAKTQDKDDKKMKSATERKGKKVSQELSKDEATIKRLKSFVTACGLRKPWVKLLAGCDTPSQQIKKLKEILAELGMSGRMSLDQAKKIKAKRELAKELEEVQSFAQPTVGRSSRSKNTSKPEEENESDEESKEEMMPTRRNRRSALLSITAFLGDQSDDD